jgi:hypothetical protein
MRKFPFPALILACNAMALLSGCAVHYHRVMDRDMNALVGQDIQVAVKKLGLPSNTFPLGNEKVYLFAKNDCTIKMATDGTGRITRDEYDGSRRECEQFYDMLDAD